MNQKVELSTGALTTGRTVSFAVVLTTAILMLLAAFSPPAEAEVESTRALPDGTQRTTYTVGPIAVTSGQNRIAYKPIVASERPSVNGWITRIQPNLTYQNGTVPSSAKVMFHHGVWLNQSRTDATMGGPERFYATGEEKTNMDLPDGYGYRYKKTDVWLLNHMLHNLTPEAMSLYITYTVDFIPDTAPQAAAIKPVRPIWMDVDNGSIYPVFDVHRGEGGADGEFTYPQDATNPYGNGPKKNEWTVDRDGVLVGTTGHVHTGGLNTELFLRRQGASYEGPGCEKPVSHDAEIAKYDSWLGNIAAGQKKIVTWMRSKKVKRLRKVMRPARFKRMMKPKQARLVKLKKSKSKILEHQGAIKVEDEAAKATFKACQDTVPTVEGNRVRLFNSEANYFEPAGPVSWDVAMMSTPDDWRVQVKAGDVLDLQTTYETKIASWYESMGINVAYMSDETDGDDPFKKKVDGPGVLNHGHYDENNDHGGTAPVVGPDPATLPDGLFSAGPFKIGGYSYEAGDFRLPGALGRPPVITKGQSFTFQMATGDLNKQIWHSLTSCKSPCNKSTGIAYPIPDGEFQFDSGQLGTGGPPTVGRTTWSTPANLPVGTHTYFCRIHPLMRGAIRVKAAS